MHYPLFSKQQNGQLIVNEFWTLVHRTVIFVGWRTDENYGDTIAMACAEDRHSSLNNLHAIITPG
jgi:hypothetical protein